MVGVLQMYVQGSPKDLKLIYVYELLTPRPLLRSFLYVIFLERSIMVKTGCVFTQEISVTYKKDTTKIMSYMDYIISENLQYLSVMQKLRIINEIVSEAKTNFTFDEIINHLPHKNGSVDIDETRLS